jgi:hypothetical protein
MELDRVSSRIIQKRLSAGVHVHRIGDVDSRGTKFGYRRLDIGHPDGEVLAEIARYRRLDQMELLTAEIDPGAGDAEVRSVVAQPSTEALCVKGDGLIGVGDIEGYVMDPENLHETILPFSPRVGNRLDHGWPIGT